MLRPIRNIKRTGRLALWLVVLATGVAVGLAQPVAPRMGYVYPAGGRQGATFQVRIGGQFLDGVTNVYFSGAGVQGVVMDHNKPLTQQQVNALQEKLKELQEKRSGIFKDSGNPAGPDRSTAATNRTWTVADQQMIADIRKKLANRAKRQINPGLSEIVTVQVTIAADAEPGARELRLGTRAGLTNPRAFHVDQLPEVTESETTNTTPPAETRITLPTVLNGQILPGAVDRFRFYARQGVHLVIAANARELIPYLPDAVPGWFQAVLTLCDSKGNELAFADAFRFHPDPVLYYEIPKDGDYTLQVRDALYRGREDFVYRIRLGELTFVTDHFPLGGRSGSQTPVELTGWNLRVAKLTQDARDKGPGIYDLDLPKEAWMPKRVPFAVDALPESLEQEPNNLPVSAQTVALPIIINGRIDQPGDCDVFRFEGRAGEEVVAEVYARRLDSPLDSVLKLTDPDGRQLAFNDDHEDKGSGLNTHHADSWLRATLPANGAYYVHLSDAQRQGGAAYGYRLRISPPRPDFDLRVVPSSVNARAGATVPLTVYALRKDGFSGAINLALKDAPKGFVLSGAWVPDRQDQVRLTLTMPAQPVKEPYRLQVEGRATIQGQEMLHHGVPADDMMQAFSYRHLVPAQDLMVSVTGRWMPRDALKILAEAPVKIPAGGTTRVRLAAPARVLADQFQFELSDPPEGVSLRDVTRDEQGIIVTLASEAAKVKPGLKGNLIVSLFPGQAMAGVGRGNALRNIRRQSLGVLPAVPFEIVKPN